MRSKIVLATRSSKLAMVQANLVKSALEKYWQGLQVEILSMKTSGDLTLDRPLREVGGKSLFVKEIEEALLQKRADIAVHSMKDVPSILPEGLEMGAILKREDSRDILISSVETDSVGGDGRAPLHSLKSGARVGTSSLRRKIQLLQMRPDLEIKDLRGNIDTRLRKLEEKEFDGIVLAYAGVKRLGLSLKHFEFLPLISAAGQGAIGIEIRTEDHDLKDLLKPLNDSETALCVNTERAVSRKLEGECELPVGAHAEIVDNKLKLRGFLANPNGTKFIQDEVSGDLVLAESLAESLSAILFSKGAGEILEEIKRQKGSNCKTK